MQVADRAHVTSSGNAHEDNKFYVSDRVATKLSREKAERACHGRMRQGYNSLSRVSER